MTCGDSSPTVEASSVESILESATADASQETPAGALAAMLRRYSNRLRMDLEKGLIATTQQVVKPTIISGFGEFAYA